MKLFRKLQAGETDFERLLGIYVLTPLGLLLLVLNSKGWLPPCLFRHLTGLPCPTCGAVHTWDLLLSGRWRAALLNQPLMLIAEVIAVLFVLYSWITVLLNTPRLRLKPIRLAILIPTLVTLTALNWIYLLLS